MPLLKLETTVVLPEEKRQALLASLSKIVAETIGKPEQYVMVTANRATMLMAGNRRRFAKDQSRWAAISRRSRSEPYKRWR